jgi:hypothetical protein
VLAGIHRLSAIMAMNSPDISDMGEGEKKPTLLDKAGAAAAQAAGQVCPSIWQHDIRTKHRRAL